ncbi:hypothetical protein CICLE_v10004498mg [Citrus x clementina]|uniref:Cwf19-like C-terminal domain-containing protein n=1 Tax=Citrus clementina TaxID=85681 RepID=V4S1Q8_CITCL|nr:hypothetical protein CICLE_v10004498mg [Citrus x clementina]
MLAGVKFMPRDQVDKAEDEKLDAKGRKSSSRKEKLRRKKKGSSYGGSSDDDLERIKKRSRRSKNWYSLDEHSVSESEIDSEDSYDRDERKYRSGKKKSKRSTDKGSRTGRKHYSFENYSSSGSDYEDQKGSKGNKKKRNKERRDKDDIVNMRELNPYLKDNGSGYPEDENGNEGSGEQLLSSSLVGDGGASWRLKALKQRWGSLGQLAIFATSHRDAPSRAHLHAIKNRKSGLTEDCQAGAEDQKEKDTQNTSNIDYLRDVSLRHPDMRAPKARDSLSWAKRKGQHMSARDANIVSDAFSGLNKFENDGIIQQGKDPGGPVDSHLNDEGNVESEVVLYEIKVPSESTVMIEEGLGANNLAAKAKHVIYDLSVRKRKDDDDADRNLAQKIMHNKQYSISGRVDDEYDFEEGPSQKSRKKRGANDNKGAERAIARCIMTQQERCLFCFENPNRPRHLVVAIANFTYLVLPQWESVVPGHCCILPVQHELATRTVYSHVWDEIRNFKKCLIMMFAKQEKELVFLETVMGLGQQRRHCLIECNPLPQKIAKQALVYFKKAIDEAEDEWSQHNAKKLIDTSVKGLRGSIPKDFPYFHIEFGLNKGFVHVIDDETQFKSSFGLNVIRGMLRLPEEDMYRRRRHESVETQKQAVATFAQDWEPFDWTKQLE